MRPLRAGLAAAIALGALALPARAEVHDSLPDLLSAWVAIQEDPTPPWEAAWLRYEASQSAWLDATLWAGHTPAQKAEQLDQTLHETGPGFAQQMGLLTAFERGWASDLVVVNEGLRREFGQVPLVELYLAYSLSPARLAIGEYGGRPSICLNVRRALPYRSEATRVLLARYLFEWLVPRWTRSRPPSVGDRLHMEGLSVWAAARVLPGVGDDALLDVTPAQLAELQAGRSRYAAIVLAALDAQDSEASRRLFGSEPPAGWPPATGPYVGLLVARTLAQTTPVEKMPAMSHAAFMAEARRVLGALASEGR